MIYDELTNFILNTDKLSDSDILTLYNFALGNKHELSRIAADAGSFEAFKALYKKAEKDAEYIINYEY